jgi:hypothetical protein
MMTVAPEAASEQRSQKSVFPTTVLSRPDFSFSCKIFDMLEFSAANMGGSSNLLPHKTLNSREPSTQLSPTTKRLVHLTWKLISDSVPAL